MDNFLFLPRAVAGALYDLLFAATTGILLCTLWLNQATPALRRTLHTALIVASSLLLLALAVQLWLTTATMLGTTAARQILPELRDVLTTTHAGRMAAAAILPAAALLTVSLFNTRAPATRRQAQRAGFVSILALVILRAATGHAVANGDFTLDEAMQLLHLCATAVWAGAIMAAGLLLAPAMRAGAQALALTQLGRSVSRYATVAIVLVIATGIFKSWRGLGGTLPPLAHTQWGILLTIKSGLVLLALLLGLYNRVLLRRNAVLLPSTAQTFARSLRLEAILMIAILTLSSFLANSPPANGS